MQAITITPIDANPAPDISYTVTGLSHSGLNFNALSTDPVSIGTIDPSTPSVPPPIVLPDLTGVSADTYTFTITATDSITSISATYILEVVIQPEPLSALNFNDATVSVTRVKRDPQFEQPMQIVTLTPIHAGPTPIISYTVTGLSHADLNLNNQSTDPVSIGTIDPLNLSVPPPIILPEMTGVSVGTYTFTITATDSITSISATYILEVVIELPPLSALNFNDATVSVTRVRSDPSFNQPMQAVTIVPFDADPVPDISYTVTGLSHSGLNFNTQSTDPVSIGTIDPSTPSVPPPIVLPDLTGVSADTYTFTITATDSFTSILGTYVFEVVILDPCLITPIIVGDIPNQSVYTKDTATTVTLSVSHVADFQGTNLCGLYAY